MKIAKALFAATAFAIAGAASAQLHSPEEYVGTLPAAQSTLSRAEVLADLAHYQRAAATEQSHSPEDYVGLLPAAQSQRQRAEVQAELALWNRAGLSLGGDSQEVGSPDYAQRLAVYQNLRSGPEYLAELSRLQPSSTVAGTAAAATVH